MKVNEGLKELPHLRESMLRESTKAVRGRTAEFKSNLLRSEEVNYESRLKLLAGEILTQGEKLAKKLDIAELKVYKRMISEFLEQALKRSYKFSKESLLDRRGRHRIYAIIRKINNELDELTKDILSKEKDNVKLLERINELTGLILDILL